MKLRARSGDRCERPFPTLVVTAEPTNLEKATRSGKLAWRVIYIMKGYFLDLGPCFELSLWFLFRFTC